MVGQRLLFSLQLLHNAEVASQLPHARAWQEETARLFPILALLNQEVDSLKKLHWGHIQLAHRLEELSINQADQAMIQLVLQQKEQNRLMISGIRRTLDTFIYPFEHAKGKVGLGKFVLAEEPHRDDLRAIFAASEDLLQSATRLRARVTGHLCLIVEGVENALGLAAMPSLPDREPGSMTETA